MHVSILIVINWVRLKPIIQHGGCSRLGRKRGRFAVEGDTNPPHLPISSLKDCHGGSALPPQRAEQNGAFRRKISELDSPRRINSDGVFVVFVRRFRPQLDWLARAANFKFEPTRRPTLVRVVHAHDGYAHGLTRHSPVQSVPISFIRANFSGESGRSQTGTSSGKSARCSSVFAVSARGSACAAGRSR